MYHINKSDDFVSELKRLPNVFVGDTDLFENMFGITTGAQVTLRYIARSRIGRYRDDRAADGFQVLLVCKHLDVRFIESQGLLGHVLELQSVLSKLFHHKIPVITCSTELESLAVAKFGVFNSKLRRIDVLTADELAARLVKFEPALNTETGCKKGLNAGAVDSFQLFSRAYLPAVSCVNDIDALVWSGERVFDGTVRIIELKRIRSNVKYWSPFVSDAGNYIAQLHISKCLNADSPLVVTYSASDVTSDEIALHRIKTATLSSIESEKSLCSLESVLNFLRNAVLGEPRASYA